MSANTLSYNAIGTLVSNIVSQATGKAVMQPITEADFLTVANCGLLAGYDNLMSSISQVLSKTVISNRPYTRRFKGLEADSIRWGNHVRKINYVDRDWEDGSRLPITTGVAVDDQAPTKDDVLQTNFYGQNDVEIPWTIFSNQLDVAFESREAFGAYISGLLQNISDMTEQKHESLARAALGGLMGAILSVNNPYQIVHLVTEYNTYVGNSPAKTLTELRASDEYPAFVEWIYGRFAQVASMLTERTTLYHQNVTNLNGADKTLARHTPYAMQNIFISAAERFQMESRVIADIYHDNYLKMATTEALNFWQSSQTPDSIDITPIYLDTDGDLKTGTAINQANIFGMICDRESVGYTTVNQRSTSAAYNGKGEYQNFWLKFTDRYWIDQTENAVIFIMD